MKRPKRDNSRTKSASGGTDSLSVGRHRLYSANSSPRPRDEANQRQQQQRRTSMAYRQTTTAAEVMNKVPKMNGDTTRRAWARQETSIDEEGVPTTPGAVHTQHTPGAETAASSYTGMRDSTTASSPASSNSSALHRPFDNVANLFCYQQQPLNCSNNFSPNGTLNSINELLFASPSTPMLHQIGPSQIGSMPPLSYGPFGLPQIGGLPAVHQHSLLLPFHQQQHNLMEQQQPQQQLLHPLPFGPGLNAVGLMPVPQNAFEGLPIFVLPHAGTLSLSALKRAAEFKAMALSALLFQQQQGAKLDTSKHFHIFVGDLSQDVDNQMLMEACQKFGVVSEAKVMRDPQSSKSRSFGFVAFPNKEDARRAMDGLNGMTLGRRPLRTGWAMRKSSTLGLGGDDGHHQQNGGSEDEKGNQPTQRTVVLTLESIYNSTDMDNSTIYLGGLPIAVTEEPIRSLFSQFGSIREIRLFASQNFGFVVFGDKSSAARAIFEMNGRELDLGVVAGKCNVRVKWGRQPQQQQHNAASATTTTAGANERNGAGVNNGTVPNSNNNTFMTLMGLSQQRSAAASAASMTAIAAARLAQQQQFALSALAIQRQQHVQQQMPLMTNEMMQKIANGTTGGGTLATFGGWGNE